MKRLTAAQRMARDAQAKASAEFFKLLGEADAAVKLQGLDPRSAQGVAAAISYVEASNADVRVAAKVIGQLRLRIPAPRVENDDEVVEALFAQRRDPELQRGAYEDLDARSGR